MPNFPRWGASALATGLILAFSPPPVAADEAGSTATLAWPYPEPSYLGLLGDRRPLDGSYRTIPTAQWSGFYVGGHLGGALGSTGTDGSDLGDVSTDGFAGGILGGYNIQLGSIVAGVEADVAWANISGDDSAGGLEATAGHDWLGSLRGRLGYATENWLLYATAGFAFTEFNVDLIDAGTHLKDSARPNGFVYGGGVEYSISPQLSLRGEVLRYSFEDMDFEIPSGAFSADPDVTTVRAGLSLRFN